MPRVLCDERTNCSICRQLGTWDPLVITTRVGSIGITAIIVHSKMPFEKAFDALMTLTASIGRFYYMTYECDFITKWA